MPRKNQVKNNKARISFKRRISLYYLRTILTIKIIIFSAILVLVFTNFFDKQKKNIFDKLLKITADYGFVLESLVIEGQRNITSEEIMEAIEADKGAPLYSLNIDDIRKRIEDNPWVKLALVERRLPDSLYIAIIEKAPIAIWQFKQKTYLIDEEGNRITSKNIEKFPELLHVVGQDANVYARNLLEDLDRYPTLAKKVISAVRYGHRRWDLNLEQKINVKMPEKNFNEAYNYLNLLNNQDKLFNQNYKVINLKDPNKYYIEKYEL